jgi:hypothetical protein
MGDQDMPEDIEPGPAPKEEPPPHPSVVYSVPADFDPDRFNADADQVIARGHYWDKMNRRVVPNRHYFDRVHQQIVPNGFVWDAVAGSPVKASAHQPSSHARRKRGGRPRSAAVAKKAIEATELRIRGYTFDQIAEHLDYTSRQHAHHAVTSVLNHRKREVGDQLLNLLLERLDRLYLAASTAAYQGDLHAIAACQKVIDQIMKLAGVEPPRKIALTTPDGTHAMDTGQPVDLLSILAKARDVVADDAAPLKPNGHDRRAGL